MIVQENDAFNFTFVTGSHIGLSVFVTFDTFMTDISSDHLWSHLTSLMLIAEHMLKLQEGPNN